MGSAICMREGCRSIGNERYQSLDGRPCRETDRRRSVGGNELGRPLEAPAALGAFRAA